MGGLAPHTLIPRLPPGAIPRPDLDDLLDTATARRLTTVCAGPGWGKTMAVAGWLQRRPAEDRLPVAWLSARPQTDDVTSFWGEVLASLRASGTVPPGHPLHSLSASAGVFDEVLISILTALDSLPNQVLLSWTTSTRSPTGPSWSPWRVWPSTLRWSGCS